MHKTYRLIFLLFFLCLIISSTILMINTKNDINKMTFTTKEIKSLQLDKNFFILFPNSENYEYKENMGAQVFKDSQKIIIFDKDIEDTRDFFMYEFANIKSESDILKIMSSKIGYLINSEQNSTVESLTINSTKKIKNNTLSLIMSTGIFNQKDNVNKYNFISYSFIYNSIPHYIICIDITPEQNLNLIDFLSIN